MRWRRRSDGHLGRAAADRPDGDDHKAGVRGNGFNHVDLEDHLDHVLERILGVELSVGFIRQRELVRDLIGGQHERREHRRWRHRWRRQLDRPEPAGRWRRWRHAKRGHLHRHQLVGLFWLGQRRRRTPIAAARRGRRSAHLFFGVVPVVVVVVFGTAFVTSVALYSTRVPG